VALAGQRAEFVTALDAAPVWLLVVAAVLQIVWLAVRSETWSLCVGGAGGRVNRRLLYPAASIGYLGNLLNGQFGLAVRIAALRRSAHKDSPRASVLAATEVPIVVVEAALVALLSFTLVGPLGLDWWIPPVGLAITIAAMIGLRQLARDRRRGVWKGLAIMRELSGRNRIIGLVVVAVCLQVARNWFVLNGVGVDASVFDSVALLIGMSVLGVLPIGPSIGAASAVIVFGADTGAAAAAGALLTATAAVGALCFAASARLGSARRGGHRRRSLLRAASAARYLLTGRRALLENDRCRDPSRGVACPELVVRPSQVVSALESSSRRRLQTEPLQRRGGKARPVALVTEKDHPAPRRRQPRFPGSSDRDATPRRCAESPSSRERPRRAAAGLPSEFRSRQRPPSGAERRFR
jgi:hypothetical protein